MGEQSHWDPPPRPPLPTRNIVARPIATPGSGSYPLSHHTPARPGSMTEHPDTLHQTPPVCPPHVLGTARNTLPPHVPGKLLLILQNPSHRLRWHGLPPHPHTSLFPPTRVQIWSFPPARPPWAGAAEILLGPPRDDLLTGGGCSLRPPPRGTPGASCSSPWVQHGVVGWATSHMQ